WRATGAEISGGTRQSGRLSRLARMSPGRRRNCILRDGSFWHWILGCPVNARSLAAMRRGDVFGDKLAVRRHAFQQRAGGVGAGDNTGALHIAGGDEIKVLSLAVRF